MSAIFGGSGIRNKARLDLYVSDVNGLDANDGLTPATAVKTLAGALSKIWFTIVAFDVIIHVGRHAGAGYTWATIDGYTLIDGASIYVYGDGAGQAGEDGFTEVLASTVALAGSDDTKVVSAALVVDTYLGNTLQILTGAAAGDLRTIKENTATDILSPTRFSAAVVAGDTYRIVVPSVVFDLPATSAGTTVLCAGLGSAIRTSDGAPPASTTTLVGSTRSMFFLVNVELDTGSVRVETRESAVAMFGVLFGGTFNYINSSGEIDFGMTSKARADAPALVATTLAWHGWGLTGNIIEFFGAASRSAIVVAKITLIVAAGRTVWWAGRINGTTDGLIVGGASDGPSPWCLVGSYGLVASQYLGVKINTTTGPCIYVNSEAVVQSPNLGSTSPLTLVSTTGTGITVDGFSVCNIFFGHLFPGGFSLTTGGFGVSCRHGGRALLDHDMYDNIVATLGAFTLDEVVGETWPAGAHPGWFISAPDGSAIVSGD